MEVLDGSLWFPGPNAELCHAIHKSFNRQLATRKIFRRKDQGKYSTVGYGSEQSWNQHHFDASVFCDGLVHVIAETRAQLGPEKPPGVLNTPITAPVGSAPVASGSGGGGGVAAGSVAGSMP